MASKTSSMIPHVLTKKPVENISNNSKTNVSQLSKKLEKTLKNQSMASNSTEKTTNLPNYTNSDSEDEIEVSSSTNTDFFSLTNPLCTSTLTPSLEVNEHDEIKVEHFVNDSVEISSLIDIQSESTPHNTLVSNIMNLPKQEILLKNKTEVGPKLPVPEQEYNVDSEGNVAIDEKAIEYLCGKRGVKRKNELSNVDVIEISGEDIKPDEREWLVKALTEEQVMRPASTSIGGGQSKKKHQITYLAHQAKAMELELKNQWAQNKANKQQARAKYGF